MNSNQYTIGAGPEAGPVIPYRTMEPLKFVYNDGGRSRYFKAGGVGDCVTRAIAIVTARDYLEVYKEIGDLVGYTPRNGIKHKDVRRVVEHFGGVWTPCTRPGQGTTTHLRTDELPYRRIICRCSGHLVAVLWGQAQDIYDPTRDGTRAVYGYWTFY